MPEARLENGIALSYVERGAVDGPVVVLLPGPTDSWRSFEPVLASLPRHLRVVAVSLRGHGSSSKPASGYRVEDLADDVVPLLDTLGIERAVLVGHSGSCLIARRVAILNPDRIGGLVLEASPTTLRADADLLHFVESVVDDLTEPVDRDFAKSFIEATSTEALPARLLDRLIDDLLEVPVTAWKQMFGSLLAYDDTAELSRVRAPAMLIWGDRDRLVSRSKQEELLQLLPRARLTIYEGAGHTPRWEQPDRYALDVAAFTSRIYR